MNCYIVTDNDRAILIDTGRKKYRDKILEKCREQHVSLIVLTHGHMDHCQNAAYLANALHIPIAMNKKDSLEVFEPIIYLKNGDDLSGYGIAAKIVELPGHTKGSVGIMTEDKLFVGDALMNMFYPTVSMLYVDKYEMLASAEYISELGEITIYFGHGKLYCSSLR